MRSPRGNTDDIWFQAESPGPCFRSFPLPIPGFYRRLYGDPVARIHGLDTAQWDAGERRRSRAGIYLSMKKPTFARAITSRALSGSRLRTRGIRTGLRQGFAQGSRQHLDVRGENDAGV